MPQSKRNYGQSPPLVRRVAAFGVVVAACGVLYPALSPLILRLACGRYLAFSPFRCLYASVPAGRHKGKQTDRQVNWQAGKNAFRFANLKTDRQATMFFSLAWQHLALSWQLVAFLSRISDLENTLPLHPSGRAKPKARTADPGSVLLLGSRKVSGDRCLING